VEFTAGEPRAGCELNRHGSRSEMAVKRSVVFSSVMDGTQFRVFGGFRRETRLPKFWVERSGEGAIALVAAIFGKQVDRVARRQYSIGLELSRSPTRGQIRQWRRTWRIGLLFTSVHSYAHFSNGIKFVQQFLIKTL